MFAAHHELNLVAIIDDNQQSCANFTHEILNNRVISEKFYAFGWAAHDIDGHQHHEITNALDTAMFFHPRCVVAQTTKGKGIGFMEANPAWHHQTPTGDQIEIARKALA